MPLMQAVTDGPRVIHDDDCSLRMMDITAPEGDVQIQIRPDGKILWVHIEGQTILRICRIEGKIEIQDERTDYELIERLRLVPREVLEDVVQKIRGTTRG